MLCPAAARQGWSPEDGTCSVVVLMMLDFAVSASIASLARGPAGRGICCECLAFSSERVFFCRDQDLSLPRAEMGVGETIGPPSNPDAGYSRRGRHSRLVLPRVSLTIPDSTRSNRRPIGEGNIQFSQSAAAANPTQPNNWNSTSTAKPPSFAVHRSVRGERKEEVSKG